MRTKYSRLNQTSDFLLYFLIHNLFDRFFVSYAQYFTIPFDKKVFDTAPAGSNITEAYESVTPPISCSDFILF